MAASTDAVPGSHSGPINRSGVPGYAALLPLVAAVVIFAWTMWTFGRVSDGPRAKNFGGDFALNMTSAVMMKHGANPYDRPALLRAETSYLNGQGIPTHLDSSALRITWVGYPPLYFRLLEPLTTYPFRQVAIGWILCMYTCMALGFLAALRFAGWTKRLLPCMLLLALPQAVLHAYYANVAAFLFAVTMWAVLLQKRFPFQAGMLLSLTLVKPQLAMFGLAVVILVHARNPRTVLVGWLTGAAALAALELLIAGPHSTEQWVAGLASVSSISGEQPNMAPLMGLYAGWAPAGLRTALEVAVLATAFGLTVAWKRRLRGVEEVPLRAVAWLWGVWFLALPYAHFPDEIFLVLPLLALLGRDARNLTRAAALSAMYVMVFSVLLYSAAPHHVQLLSLPLLVLTAVSYRDARRSLTTVSTAMSAAPELGVA
jgi:hypothetical protein